MGKQHFLCSSEKIIVQKKGMQICVLSRFNKTKNAFMIFREGNHLWYFLDPDLPFESGRQGELFHTGWDDFAPYICENYGTVGANHGSPFACKISTIRHWLDERDIGRELYDDAGQRFIITDIKNPSEYLIHGVPVKQGNAITFNQVCGSLYLDGVKVNGSLQQVQYSTRNAAQLAPHHRYNSCRLLANGTTPLADGEICECDFAVSEWDIDLCPPDALLDHLAGNPGKYISPIAPELPALLNNFIRFEFQPSCAYTVDSRITILQDRDDSLLYSLLQSYNETQPPVQKKIIPGLKPFSVTEENGNSFTADFSSGEILPQKKYRRLLTKEDAVSADKLPNEFIDLWGDGEKWLWGEVIGYSTTAGITRRGAEHLRSDQICLLPTTGKNYPYALYCSTLRKGDKYHIAAYRQFFEPPQAPALSSYGHWDNGIYTHYSNYLAPGTVTIELPASLAGGGLTAIENGCQAILPAKIPADGKVTIKISRRGKLIFQVK